MVSDEELQRRVDNIHQANTRDGLNSPKGQECADCTWLYQIADKKLRTRLGVCTALPPTSIYQDHELLSIHPRVLMEGWCSLWEARPPKDEKSSERQLDLGEEDRDV